MARGNDETIMDPILTAILRGVEPKIGGFDPPKWMVYFMENPMYKWMIWGETPHIFGSTSYSNRSEPNFPLKKKTTTEETGRLGICI